MILFKFEDIWILVLCKIGYILKVSSTFFNNLFLQKAKRRKALLLNIQIRHFAVQGASQPWIYYQPRWEEINLVLLGYAGIYNCSLGSKSKPLCTGAETTCLAELISPTRLSKLLYLFATCPNLLAVILLFLNIVQRLLWLCALVFSSTSMVVCLKRPNTSNEVSLSC